MRRAALVALLVGMLALAASLVWWTNRPAWGAAELATLQTLALDALPPLPADPSNAVADDPRAAALGAAIFFDTRFSGNGAVACATCHQPDLFFTDGLPLGQGMGTIPLHSMSLVGASYGDVCTGNG